MNVYTLAQVIAAALFVEKKMESTLAHSSNNNSTVMSVRKSGKAVMEIQFSDPLKEGINAEKYCMTVISGPEQDLAVLSVREKSPRYFITKSLEKIMSV